MDRKEPSITEMMKKEGLKVKHIKEMTFHEFCSNWKVTYAGIQLYKDEIKRVPQYRPLV